MNKKKARKQRAQEQSHVVTERARMVRLLDKGARTSVDFLVDQFPKDPEREVIKVYTKAYRYCDNCHSIQVVSDDTEIRRVMQDGIGELGVDFQNFLTVADEKSKFVMCSGCRCIYYCSPECQRARWKGHKSICSFLHREGTQQQDDFRGYVHMSAALQCMFGLGARGMGWKYDNFLDSGGDALVSAWLAFAAPDDIYELVIIPVSMDILVHFASARGSKREIDTLSMALQWDKEMKFNLVWHVDSGYASKVHRREPVARQAA